jgi:hypothetical protein
MGSSSLKRKSEEPLVPVFQKPQPIELTPFMKELAKNHQIIYNTNTDSLKILRTGE